MPDTKQPGVEVIRRPEDLDRIEFHDGLAAVEVPFELLEHIPFAGEKREGGPRLERIIRSIRRDGYRPVDPVVCRIGMKGRWVVVDGGHRITAARRVGREWWSNLCRPKVRWLYFLLFTTPGSWSKVRAEVARSKPDAPLPESALPEAAPGDDEPGDGAGGAPPAR